MNEILTWLPLILSIFGAGAAWASYSYSSKRTKDDVAKLSHHVDEENKKIRVDVLSDITQMETKLNEQISRYDSHHRQHFEKIGELEVGIAQIGQSIHDHQEEDRKQFNRIEEWLKEQRQDIKEILKLMTSKKEDK